MSRRLTGTLKLPDGTTLNNTTIKFVAVRNEAAEILKTVSATITTDGAGLYDVTLVDGQYRVLLTYAARTVDIGTILADAGADTTLEERLTFAGVAESAYDALLAGVQAAQAAAAASEANASTSEANAATSESNASTSASNAATSETNADTSASNAATSETNAATSEASALTYWTNIEAQVTIPLTQMATNMITTQNLFVQHHAFT